MFHEGSVLKYNTLWRAGAHYSYQFFRVSHVTGKGNVMGWYLASDKKNEYFDHDISKDAWIVDFSHVPSSRCVRLPHTSLWSLISEEEKAAGKVTATSCVN